MITTQLSLKKNQNAPRPSEHPPVRGEEVVMSNEVLDRVQTWIGVDRRIILNTILAGRSQDYNYWGKTLRHIPPVLSTCSLHTISGCGKERRISIGPW